VAERYANGETMAEPEGLWGRLLSGGCYGVNSVRLSVNREAVLDKSPSTTDAGGLVGAGAQSTLRADDPRQHPQNAQARGSFPS
jgi:hypothetical protein